MATKFRRPFVFIVVSLESSLLLRRNSTCLTRNAHSFRHRFMVKILNLKTLTINIWQTKAPYSVKRVYSQSYPDEDFNSTKSNIKQNQHVTSVAVHGIDDGSCGCR